ncbi:hypothetical protein ACFPAF_07385 [Hymenobacter endophyticus]|uniref:C1q domain-containing protein n=1 Tax=Hymenobacter endophyticus TaxID=3076335 RepID=A0ABU3TFR1_9BACT|nr:hypothetical protein [Hymenobacter endophyticus]MDU0370207.1 hypothetical protein [Hymenobacter endophyticus]
MKKAFLVVLAISALSCAARAQVSISATPTTPDASAILDVSSTTKGLLPPRMTQAERGAIATPATGLIVYQTNGTAGLYCNNGTSTAPFWQLLSARAQPVYGHFASIINQPLPPNNTPTNLNLTAAFESSGLTSNINTDQITIVTPGLYRIFYNTSIFISNGAQFSVQAYKNSTAIGRINFLFGPQGSLPSVSEEGLYTLTAGDIITVKFINYTSASNVQTNGGTLTLVQIQ